METILKSYYANNAKKLQAMVNQIFYKNYGGISDKDMSEYYSVANDVFADIILNNRYDSSKGNFDDFLYISLSLAVIDEIKRQTRDKRTNKIEVEEENESGEIIKKRVPIRDVYLDAPMKDDENSTYGDLVPDKNTVESEIIGEEKREEWHKEVKKYLESLSPLQRKIAFLLSDNFTPEEICEDLHITMSHYNNSVRRIFAHEKTKILIPLVEKGSK